MIFNSFFTEDKHACRLNVSQTHILKDKVDKAFQDILLDRDSKPVNANLDT